jgi:hypothetical protein
MEIVVLLLIAIVVLDLAALRWGVDTRDGFGAVRPRPPF